MTIKHHIYAVKNLDAAGNPTDDYPFTDEFIGHMLRVARSTVLENKMSKYHPISHDNYQVIKMELVDGGPTDCSDLTCLKITKDRLPSLIRSRRGDSMRVTDLDGNELIRTSLLRSKSSAYSQTAKAVKWYPTNNRIVVVNNKLLDYILVHGLFNDPINQCGDDGCEEDFAIDADLVDPVYKITLTYLAKSRQDGEDTTNDSKNEKFS